MSSTNFTISKNSGVGNDSVKVTASNSNNSTSIKQASVILNNTSVSKTINVKQMYKPIVKWQGSQSPNVSMIGGTLYLHINCPYNYYILQVPDNVSNLYRGKAFNAGDQTIEVVVNEATEPRQTTNTIQIGFMRCDGIPSNNTEEGRYGFSVTYTQDALVPRSLSIDPEDLSAPASGGTYSVDITFLGRLENESLQIDSREDGDGGNYLSYGAINWTSSTSPYGRIEVTFAPNTSTYSRNSDYMTFMTQDGITTTLGSYQEGVVKTLTTSPIMNSNGSVPITIPADSSSRTYKVNVTSNTPWTATTSNSYVKKLSGWSGGVDGETTTSTLYFYVQDNNLLVTRQCAITIATTDGSITKLLTINQDAQTTQFLNLNQNSCISCGSCDGFLDECPIGLTLITDSQGLAYIDNLSDCTGCGACGYGQAVCGAGALYKSTTARDTIRKKEIANPIEGELEDGTIDEFEEDSREVEP